MSTLSQNTTAPFPVRLGNTSAYAFDGDSVRLDAELMLTPAAATVADRWSLQLWADAGTDAGIKLAEVALESLMPDASGHARVSATTAAHPPAGGREHTITLLLAANDGTSLRVVDAVSYPRNESFVLPRIEGEVTHRIEEAQIEVRVPRICNPRGADNVSGTLALELWALPTAYHGGTFSGVALGSSLLGTLAGQADWQDVHVRLPFSLLPNGTWHLVLMLREWTHGGYLTRDYRTLAPSIEVAAHAVIAAAAVEPVRTDDATTPVAEAEAVVVTADAARPAKKASAAGRKSTSSAAVQPARLSINSASSTELATVKGLSKRLAEGIVQGRPWVSVDDLIAVKGIGPKLLEQIRNALRP